MSNNNIGPKLAEILGDPARVLTGNAIEEKYYSFTHGRERGHADALVFPESTEEVSRVLRFAYENNIHVPPRGAGTNLTGSTVPLYGGIVLDLSRMNHILEIDEETLTAVVEPGVILEDFQNEVEARGLFYPPDPGEKKASLGGNISTNAGGMRAVRYGVTRDYVRGLEVVLSDGRVTTLGSKNVKDASGLSLKNLVIGSEGTLAVITKAILRLVPKPEASRSLIAAFPDTESGISAVPEILKANLDPTALEFVERKVAERGEAFTGVSWPFHEAGSYLLMIFDGSESSIDERTDKLNGLVEKLGAIGVKALSVEEAADIWKVRGALVTSIEAVSEQAPVDVVVPINRTADFLRFVDSQSAKTGMALVAFGHAGDGNVHLCVVRGKLGEDEWKLLHDINMSAVYRDAGELGGLISGEHGIGLTKRKYFLKYADPVALSVMNGVKRSFDPKEILNRGKSYHVVKGSSDESTIGENGRLYGFRHPQDDQGLQQVQSY